MEVGAALLGGAAVFLLALYMIRARVLRPAEARIQHLTSRPEILVEKMAGEDVLIRRDPSSIRVVTRFLDSNGFAERWRYELERADLKIRPGEYFLTRLVMATVAFVVVGFIGGNGIAFLAGAVAGVILYMLPAYYVKLHTQRRIRGIEGQLAETITLIANALRAGFAFAQGVDVAAKRVGPPIADELNRVLLDINLGSSVEDALSAMNKRIDSDDVDMVVTAILIQRQTGGNLAEVLETVTETMRDRERIRGDIKTLTASQQLTGWVLSVWPVLLGLLFFAINPSMMSLLWKTGPGLVLLGLWAVLNTLGVISIRRILDIDI